jgi:hypothetical protein
MKQRIVKNLNDLIANKGNNYVLELILNKILEDPNAQLKRYYLEKKYRTGDDASISIDTSRGLENSIDLVFREVSATDINSRSSADIIHDYNTFVSDDKLWGGWSNDDSNELKSIRTLYNGYKKNHKNLHLDAASKLTKAEMISILEEANDSDINLKIEQLKHNHRNYVPATANDLEKLEWWNYKYQGERLFCNNNRLFVFIAYTDRFTDGRELKGKTAEIGEKITELLDNLLMVDIHKINYHYDKEDSLAGNYTAWALSTIYSE